MELPNHRGLEEKLGKSRSCPGPLVWPLPVPKHPGPALLFSGELQRQSIGDRKEKAPRNQKTGRHRVGDYHFWHQEAEASLDDIGKPHLRKKR